jgi:hypothetical protein
MATSITGLTARSVGTWTNMFRNIAVLPDLDRTAQGARPNDDGTTSPKPGSRRG